MAEQQQQSEHTGSNFKEAMSKLRDRAKELVERQAAADRQERAELDRIRKKIEDENEQNRQEFARKTTALKADVVDEFRSSKDMVHQRMARMKEQIGERKDARDAKAAEKRAERAEDYAAELIAYASDDVDQADLAVLEAIAARADAEQMRQPGGAPTVH